MSGHCLQSLLPGLDLRAPGFPLLELPLSGLSCGSALLEAAIPMDTGEPHNLGLSW